MKRGSEQGFSLVELAIVVLVMGMLLTFAIPSYRSLSESYQLRGAAENIAGQLRLAREKAIGSGVTQQVQFSSPAPTARSRARPRWRAGPCRSASPTTGARARTAPTTSRRTAASIARGW